MFFYKTFIILCIFSLVALSDSFEPDQTMESRGKKKKKIAAGLLGKLSSTCYGFNNFF